MRTSRMLLSALLLLGMLVHPSSAAAVGGQFGLEFAIDAPWRIEPVPKPDGGHSYGPIPITITFLDAIYDHHRSDLGQWAANVFGGLSLEKRHVGVLQYIDITEVRQKDGRLSQYKQRLAFGNIREIERKRWLSTIGDEPLHELCRPYLGQNCHDLDGRNLYDITDSHEWHAMLWYTPRDIDVKPGENIQLIIKVVTKYKDDERQWVNAVVVHAGEQPLPRFGDQWLYGDLHYHSQMTDNEGESGYSYRNVVRTLGAMGMDFVFATDHASDSKQTALTNLSVARCPDEMGKECAIDPENFPSCQKNGKWFQCRIFHGEEARDLNQPRFTAAKQILYGPDGANQAIGRDLETTGFARFRAAGMVPQIYMGEEIDEMPEMSADDFRSGRIGYGDNLSYPWSHVSRCLAVSKWDLCPQTDLGLDPACRDKTVKELCQTKFSIVKPGDRYFAQDLQGGKKGFLAHVAGVKIEPEPSRQHLVYLPSSGAPDEAGFVSGRTRSYGGASRTLDELLREIETRGVAFLAHPLSGNEPASPQGPDLLPYSDTALERAWRSRAVLGLQFWNENDRFRSQTDEDALPLLYETGPRRNLAPLIHGAGYGVNYNMTEARAQIILEHNYPPLRDEVLKALPDINRVRFAWSRVWENPLSDGGKSYTATRPFLYPHQLLTLGNLSDEDVVRPWAWRESGVGTRTYSRLYQGAYTWDRYLRKGLNLSETSVLSSWLAPGEPRKWFMAGGSDGHGDFNYRRDGYLCESEWCEKEPVTDTAIGNPRNLVLVGSAIGAPLPGLPGAVKPYTNGQVMDALQAGRFSVTDGPALRIAIDRNRNGILDDADFQMGSTFNLFSGEQVPLLIEWISTEEFGPIKKIDIYLGTKERTLAPPNHGVPHTVCTGSRSYDPAHPGQFFLKPGGMVEDIMTGQDYSTCEESLNAYSINAIPGQEDLLRINLAGIDIETKLGYHGMAKVYLNPAAPLNLSIENGKLFYIRAYAQTFSRAESHSGNIPACTDHQGKPLPTEAPGKCGDRHVYTNPIWGRYNASCQKIDTNGDGFPDGCKAPVIDQCTGALPASGSSLRSCKFVEALPCLASSKGCGATEGAAHLLLLK